MLLTEQLAINRYIGAYRQIVKECRQNGSQSDLKSSSDERPEEVDCYLR